MKKVILYTLYPDLIKEIEVSSDLSLYDNEENIFILDISAIDLKGKNRIFFQANIDKYHIPYKYYSNGSEMELYLDNVLYFESDHRIINVYIADGGIITFYKKLDDVQEEIDRMCDFFIRISKSIYVNYMYAEVKGYKLTIFDGRIVKVTRSYREQFKEKMLQLNDI